ncbi:MAG: sulfotransferase [Alphaproteobacteria bacterium]
MSIYESMNAALRQEHDLLCNGFEQPAYPTVFTISQPRTASTLFVQLLLARFRIGYCSNLMSRFWDVPVFGAILQQDLQLKIPMSSFKTELQPEGPLEPNEWGFFWRRWLKLEGQSHYCDNPAEVDIAGLRRVLATIENVFDAPLVFDSPFTHCNIEILLGALPQSVFVWTHRELFYVCNSILNARLKRHGTIEGFFGNRPRVIDRILSLDDPVEQVVEQVYETQQEIEVVFQRLPEDRRLRLDYPEMLADPTASMDRVAALVAGNGTTLQPTGGSLPVSLPVRLGGAIVNPDFRDRLVDCFEKKFGYLPDDF